MKKNKLPSIAILGYGAMGKEVEKIAHTKNIIITDIFDIDNPLDSNKNYKFDIAIDFTFPDAVLDNVKKIIKMKKKIVIGTTGWEKDFKKIKNLITRNNAALVYGSNFSIGMQIFIQILDFASKQINNLEEYDIFMHEIHHKRKIDSPGGTALTLGKIILDNVKTKTEILTDKASGLIEKNQLHISSTRGGEVTGIHSVYIDSSADTIELTHRAKNRTGFALGAIEAAKWLHNKRGFYDFRDILNEILAD